MTGRAAAGFTLAVLMAGVAQPAGTVMPLEPGGYPPSRRVTQSDDYHGQSIGDPYRWLEQSAAPETQAWVDAQNALTRRQLDALATRAYFSGRLRALIGYERFGLPQHRAGRYVYTYNSGAQEQDSLWVTDDPARQGRLVLDPVALRGDGTVSLADFELAPNGRHLAYALSDGGTDWKTWRVRDIDRGDDLPETLRGTKFTNIAWVPDGSGFYYSRYPRLQEAAGTNPRHDSPYDPPYDDSRQVSIWYHALGTDQDRDVAIFSITDHLSRNPYPTVTEDGRYLVIRVDDGYDVSGVYYRDLSRTDASVIRLLDRWDGRYEFLGNAGPVFYFQTTQQAPAGRVIAIDTRQPEPALWREVVPEAPEAIEDATLVGGRLLVSYIVEVKSRVRVFDLDGHRRSDVGLPNAGQVEGFDGLPSDTETFFSYTDFITPRTLYRYDIRSSRSEPWRVPVAVMDADQYVTRQVRYRSRDGTQIPMYIVQRRDLPAGRPQPTVLYGYGGFNVSLLPAFSASRAAWIEAGGVYAVANLRGGGEFGEGWHEAGTRLNKQNVFDDFVAAAEWLIAGGYTTRGQLAIWGGSNGGLLVGAVLNQRPDLFAAAVPAVGVMDMLRYQLGSANARQWSSDYGLSEVPEQFKALVRYSPYHNVRAGACYPPTLVMADASDDRVAPWHSYKYAAALQNAQGCERPVLIRIETRAGHGAGASTSKIIDEYADQWAFVAGATGLVPLPRVSARP